MVKITNNTNHHDQNNWSIELLDNIPVGLYQSTIDGKITNCNKSLATMLGFDDKNKLINLNAREFYLDSEDRFDFLTEISVENPVIIKRVKLKRIDGKTFWAEISTRATFSNDNKILFFNGSIRDVTKQLELEKQLEEERNKLEKYLDIAGVIFVVINANQEVELINQKGCSILGYAEDEIIGKNWFDNFIPYRLQEEVKSVFNEIMTGEIMPVMFYENPILTKTGGERIIEWHNTFLKDSHNNIIHTISSGLDVTERKEMEERIQKAKEISQSAEFEYNIKTNHIYRSKELLNLFGYDVGDELPGSLFDIVFDNDINKIKNSFSLSIENNLPIAISFRIKTKLDTIRHMYLRAEVIYEDSKPSKILGLVQDISLQRKTDEDLRKSETRFRNIFDSSSFGMLMFELTEDNNLICIESNKSADEILRINDIRCTGQVIQDIYPQLVKSELMEKYITIAKLGGNWRGQLEFFDRELKRIFELNIFQTSFKTIVVAFEDISERKQIENELKLSEENYRGFLENFDGIAYKSGLHFRTIFFHGKVQEITGYESDDFVGGRVPWNDLIVKEDFERLKERFNSVATIPNFHDVREYRIITKTGEIKWLRDHIMNITDENNKIISAQGTLIDITSLKIAEEKIRESEEKYRKLFNNANDAIFLIEFSDPNKIGKIVEVNDIACERYGYTRDEFIHMTPFDITYADSKQKIPEQYHNLNLKTSQTFEITHVTKEGKAFPVEISSHKFNLGEKVVTLSLVRDITERKEAENEIFNAFEQIEKNLEQFSILTDSIRNPLSVIVGLIDHYGKEEKEIAIKHISLIDDIISHIDERTKESREVKEYLKKHFD